MVRAASLCSWLKDGQMEVSTDLSKENLLKVFFYRFPTQRWRFIFESDKHTASAATKWFRSKHIGQVEVKTPQNL